MLGTNKQFRRLFLIISQALRICYCSACNGKELPSRGKVLTWSCGAETWSNYFLSRSKNGLMWRCHVDHLKPLQERPSTESHSVMTLNLMKLWKMIPTFLLLIMQSLSIQTNQHNHPNHLFTRGTDILSLITINLFGMVVQSLTSWSRNCEHVVTFINTCGLLYSIVFL